MSTGQLPPTLQSLIHLEYKGDPNDLLQAFTHHKLVIVSDGSSKTNIGAGGWIITSESSYPHSWIKGTLCSLGPEKYQDSHRSEATGLLGTVLTIWDLHKQWNNPEGSVTVCCDNRSALRYAFDTLRFPTISCTFPDYDLF